MRDYKIIDNQGIIADAETEEEIYQIYEELMSGTNPDVYVETDGDVMVVKVLYIGR